MAQRYFYSGNEFYVIEFDATYSLLIHYSTCVYSDCRVAVHARLPYLAQISGEC